MEWITVEQYAERHGYSQGHVRLMAREGKITARQSGKGKKWLIAVQGQDQWDQVDTRSHHLALIEPMVFLSPGLRRLINPFPTVSRFSYRPDDPSNSMTWVLDGNTRRAEWTFQEEQESVWQFTLQHLQSGLPNTYKALREVKLSLGSYWQEISEHEQQLIADAQHYLENESDAVQLDDSRFYRSILSEVDVDVSVPSEDDYETVTRESDFFVLFRGAGILKAPDRPGAEKWIGRHLEWRRGFVVVLKPSLVRRREDVKVAAKLVMATTTDIEVRGALPGVCNICQTSETNDYRKSKA